MARREEWSVGKLVAAGMTKKVGNTTVKVMVEDTVGNVLTCSGTSIPTGAGYAKGCQFIKTDAGAGVNAIYENIGTTVVANFNLIGAVAAGEITLANGKILIGDIANKAAEQTMGTDATIAASGALTIANNAVTFAKMADLAAQSVIANPTGAGADPQAVAVSEAQVLGRATGGNVAGVKIFDEQISVAALLNKNKIADPIAAAIADATVGPLTITAAMVLNGALLRDPNGAARTDVFPTAALVVASIVGMVVGTTLVFRVVNTGSAGEPLSFDFSAAGVTLGSGTSPIIPPGWGGEFVLRVTNTAAPAYTVYFLGVHNVLNQNVSPIAGIHPQKVPFVGVPVVDATVGPTTFLAANLIANRHFMRDPNGANRADLIDTAVNIVAAVEGAAVGHIIPFWICNTSNAGLGETITLTTAAGVTLQGDPSSYIIARGQTGGFVMRLDNVAAPAVSIYPISGTQVENFHINPQALINRTKIRNVDTVTTDNTAGPLNITAAMIVGGLLLRDPNGADRTDVFPTAALIVAAVPQAAVNMVIPFEIVNTGVSDDDVQFNFAALGLTLANPVAPFISPDQGGKFFILLTNVTPAAEACTIYYVGPTRVQGYQIADLAITQAKLAADILLTWQNGQPGVGYFALTGAVADTQTVTIGTRVYEFETGGGVTPGNVAVDVTADQTADAACAALAAAVMADISREADVEVWAGNSDVTAGITIITLAAGAANLALAETCANGYVSGANTVAYEAAIRKDLYSGRRTITALDVTTLAGAGGNEIVIGGVRSTTAPLLVSVTCQEAGGAMMALATVVFRWQQIAAGYYALLCEDGGAVLADTDVIMWIATE